MFSIVNFNHAGIPERNVRIVFGPISAVSATLNIWAFSNCGLYTP